MQNFVTEFIQLNTSFVLIEMSDIQRSYAKLRVKIDS